MTTGSGIIALVYIADIRNAATQKQDAVAAKVILADAKSLVAVLIAGCGPVDALDFY